MSGAARRARARRGLVVPAVFIATVLIALVGLGTWQLERKAWKEALIGTLARRVAAAPAELPPRTTWDRLDPAEFEFQRVRLPAEFAHDQEALVYTVGSALRRDIAGPGYWVFTPARLAVGGVVVINRGFVPEGLQDPRSRAHGQVAGVVDIVGAMRSPERRGMFAPSDDPGRNLWFTRDHRAIAAAKNWGEVAPFYIDQEAPSVPGGWPKVGKIEPNLPNNHLQYAITWYGLAAALVVAFGFWLRGRQRATGP